MNEDYLQEKPEYIDILERIIEYEDNNKNPDHTFIQDTDHDSLWSYSDVEAHPTKLYQLEANGFIEKVFNSNSTTRYALKNRDEVKSMVNNINSSMDEDGVINYMHTFPSEDDLPDGLFDEVIGFDDYKWIIKRGITTDKITNFLLVGPPGSAKSVFLLAIQNLAGAEYVMASEATSAGVLDIMFERRPKYMLIDEFDDMSNDDQSVFASYTETGILKETKYNKTREMKTNTKTLGAANDRSKIKDNILDRFTVLEFDEYTRDEFIEVCENVLPMKEGKSKDESRLIAEAVWNDTHHGDVRQAIQVARLSRGDPEKVLGVINGQL